MRPRNLIIALISGTALAIGLFTALRLAETPAVPRVATILPTAIELPDFALRDHNGDPASRATFEGQWDLVFFGFTYCPDICPLTLAVLSDARERLAAEGHTPLPRIVLVSVDPERDTPDRLAEYLQAFGDSSIALTGEVDELRKLTGALGIFFEKRDTGEEFYTVDHSGVVLVIDPEGRFRALFSSPHRADNFVHDLPILQSL